MNWSHFLTFQQDPVLTSHISGAIWWGSYPITRFFQYLQSRVSLYIYNIYTHLILGNSLYTEASEVLSTLSRKAAQMTT